MTVTISFEDSKYLEAIYGGREITHALAAKVAEVKAGLAALDDFVTVGAGFAYSPTTGELEVTRDDREVEFFDIPVPASGYWSSAGFKARKVGEYVAIMLRPNRSRPSAEGMFDWPIYRAALQATVGEEAYVAGYQQRTRDERANTAFAQSVSDILNANREVK